MSVYAGPYIRVEQTPAFDPWEYTEAINHRLSAIFRSDGSIYFITNKTEVLSRQATINEDDETFVLADPNAGAELVDFTQVLTREIERLSLDAAYTLHWGVFAYHT